MYMTKYIPQPTHPSLSPGSDPMPDFCVGKHTVGRKDAMRGFVYKFGFSQLSNLDISQLCVQFWIFSTLLIIFHRTRCPMKREGGGEGERKRERREEDERTR